MEAEPPSPDGDKSGSAVDEHVGKQLRAQRLANGLEIITIAATLGVEERRVANWEAGLYRIPSRYLILISKLLSCSLTVFFEGYPNDLPVDEEIDPSEGRVNWLFSRLSAKH